MGTGSVSNNKGFSLVELIVVAGVGVIIMSVMGQFMITQSKQISYFEDRISHSDFNNYLRIKYLDDANCDASINGLTLINDGQSNFVPSESILDKSGKPVKQAFMNPKDKNLNTYDQLNLNKVYLQEVDVFENGNTGLAELVFEVSRQRKGGGPQQLKPIRIPASVTMDPATNAVVNCSILGSNGAGSSPDCLKTIHVQNLNSTYVVPSGVKAMQFNYSGTGTSSGWVKGDPEPGSFVLHLGAKVSGGATTFDVGSTVKLITKGTFLAYSEVYINGVLAFKKGYGSFWGSTPVPHTVNVNSGTLGAVCETPSAVESVIYYGD